MGTRKRIIWGKWDCSQCSTKGISAEPPKGEKQPVCPTCGSPRERTDGEADYLDNARDPHSGKVLNANVADTAEEIKIASAGPDWTCKNCGGDNRASEGVCTGCNAPREERQTGPTSIEDDRPTREVTRKPHWPPPEVTAAWENILKEKNEETIRKESFDKVTAERWDKLSQNDAAAPASNFKAILAFGCTGIAAGLLCGFFVWGCQEHDVDGKVTSTDWSRHIDKDTFTLVRDSDWEQNISGAQAVMPVDGRGERAGEFDVSNCTRKYWGETDKYACGTKNVCTDGTKQVRSGSHEVCSTRSNGNGSHTETCHDVTDYKSVPTHECHNVTKYCTDPIYKQWCSYSTYKWKFNDSADSQGHNASSKDDLYWPTMTIGPRDRISKSENFKINVSYGPDKTTWKAPNSVSEYLSYQPEQTVKVSVTNFGTVSDVKH